MKASFLSGSVCQQRMIFGLPSHNQDIPSDSLLSYLYELKTKIFLFIGIIVLFCVA